MDVQEYKEKRKEQSRLANERFRKNNSEKAKQHRDKYLQANREKLAAKSLEWWKTNKDKSKNSYLKRTYNITLADYQALELLQENKCACCGIHKKELSKPLVVDHDHLTGKIRGLLCDACNVAIGGLGDNINSVYKAIEYLQAAVVTEEVITEFRNTAGRPLELLYHPGVNWNEQKQRWKASIRVNNKRIHLGSFKSLLEAVKARNTFIDDNKDKVSVAKTPITEEFISQYNKE